ncbi:MAG: DUF72 domain-containing protein [Alphaproteobacteria bacterium]
MTGTVRIGTSGWHYKPWIGPFYPEGTRPNAFLAYYATRFSTAEVNSTFYGLPRTATVTQWRESTPPDFLFSCKASRYITHIRRLREPAEGLGRFFGAVEALEDKLGPVLFQLPPRWLRNRDRLAAFLEALPGGHRYAFEFRDESWLEDEVFDLLDARGAACCHYDFDRRQPAVRSAADFVYIRLHGPLGAYRGSYDDRALAGWARRIADWSTAGRDVFCYFDNDEAGYAARDAQRLIDMIDGP